MKLILRDAIPGEAHYLSELASRSKAHWPYDESYLALVRGIVHLTEDDIQKWPVRVAVSDSEICGFSMIVTLKDRPMLDHLWIKPKFIGKGIGQMLFSDAIERARELEWKRLEIASDPYAEKFYLKQGARRIGDWPSKVLPGFYLPHLEFDIPCASPQQEALFR